MLGLYKHNRWTMRRVDPVISTPHPDTWVVTAIHMAQRSELIRKLPGMEGRAGWVWIGYQDTETLVAPVVKAAGILSILLGQEKKT